VSWLEAERKTVAAEASYNQTLLERSADALSNVNGVNMDDEMSFMLQVERTYSATSKLIATIDQMLQNLLQAVR
jgi:flagellar hook-associated protein 1 FlgK